MKVRMEFAADGRPADDPQILWAEMPQEEYEELKARTEDPAWADGIVGIDSWYEGSKVRLRLYRLGRLKVSKEKR